VCVRVCLCLLEAANRNPLMDSCKLATGATPTVLVVQLDPVGAAYVILIILLLCRDGNKTMTSDAGRIINIKVDA
jgi:hypothetical protein